MRGTKEKQSVWNIFKPYTIGSCLSDLTNAISDNLEASMHSLEECYTTLNFEKCMKGLTRTKK